MKTISQIHKKAQSLKRQLSQQTLKENFGDNAQILLSQFIGDIYQYSYDDRLVINQITSNFFNWCINYTG